MHVPGFKLLNPWLDRLWQADLHSLNTPVKIVVLFLRVAHLLFRDLFNGAITMRASSLAYTTLLSLIPLLAVAISTLKAFGVQYELEPLLKEYLLPLGEKANDIALEIIFFVERIDINLLGTMGVLVFLYTAISLIAKIEDMLNDMWHITTSRNIFKRFGYYLAVILFAPLLIFIAVGLTASMMNSGFVTKLSTMEPFGTLFYLLGYILPILFSVVAFTLVYLALPNAKVSLSSAIQAALAATILWKIAGWIFATFIAAATRYHAVYAGLATMVLFMIWMQLSWVIFLIGAKMAYLIQFSIKVNEPQEPMHQEVD